MCNKYGESHNYLPSTTYHTTKNMDDDGIKYKRSHYVVMICSKCLHKENIKTHEEILSDDT